MRGAGRPAADAAYQVWCVGDSAALSREPANLVLHVRKRATAGLLWDAESDPPSGVYAGGPGTLRTGLPGNREGIASLSPTSDLEACPNIELRLYVPTYSQPLLHSTGVRVLAVTWTEWRRDWDEIS